MRLCIEKHRYKKNERLQIFEHTSDGFELAEKDLQLRGAGDLVGTRQSGLSELRVADLARDAEIVARAQQVARTLLDADPQLDAEDLTKLKRQVLSRHGSWLQLSDVG